MSKPVSAPAPGPAPTPAPGPGPGPGSAPGTALPRQTIATGNCIELMNAWPAGAADAGVDLIFADPPYNIGYRYDQYEDKRDDAEYVQWTRDWITACARLLKPTGSLFILIGDEYAAETRLHLKQLERDRRLAFRNWLVWHYTFGQNCRAKFNRSHAHLFYCVGPALLQLKANQKLLKALPFTFNRAAVAVPSARQTTYNDARANPTGKLPDDIWYLRPQEALDATPTPAPTATPPPPTPPSRALSARPGSAADPADPDHAAVAPWLFDPDGDTWYLSRLCGTFRERQGWHPCQLPEALLERIVKVASHPGDLVFDPFAGSGTTLAVAARLGRQWLGCELSADYAARALQRIEHTTTTGATHTRATEKRRTATVKKPERYRSQRDRDGNVLWGAAK